MLQQELLEGAEKNGLRYVVSEYLYEGQNGKPNWIHCGVHKCEEFYDPPETVDYRMELNACKGFLLLKAQNSVSRAHELTWLYDLSKTNWQKDYSCS